jgi:hypothetical protein
MGIYFLKSKTVANRPTFNAILDLTPDLLNALKKAGANERGNYSLEMAVWPNEKMTCENSPNLTGLVKLKGDRSGGPQGYGSVWTNDGDSRSSSSSSSTDLF